MACITLETRDTETKIALCDEHWKWSVNRLKKMTKREFAAFAKKATENG